MNATVAVDLRSDTLTLPTRQMFEAMTVAQLGDDVYGEDPTVNSLQQHVAAMFGCEAGLFTPTGSLSNQLGLRTLVGPGEEVVTDSSAHILRAELGAAAAFAGVTSRTYDTDDGLLDVDRVAALIRPRSSPYLVATTAIAVENTHNFGGGRVQPIAALRQLRDLADANGLALHLDGARIWNAHVASGVPLADYGALFDTVSVCFSKGLGAPIGSMLLSTCERIDAARVWRKRLGAGMRQVGVLAGAARYAVDNNVGRLSEDHARARRLAVALAEVAPEVVDPSQVDTNIVLLDYRASGLDAAAVDAAARTRGVATSVLGPAYARLVTHMGIDDVGVDRAADVLGDILRRALAAGAGR
ncbi:MAG: low specificity L-threonine aldolase [Actinobacteria bacterium]|nr:MAG: low specificity L-threonine aldolase [Actinomycetota bacterium]